MPEARATSGDLRPAAVHDHRQDPGALQQRDVLGERRGERRPLHRGAAVLDDDDLAAMLRMNGSASTSVVRLRDRALADLRRQVGGRSRRVLPVDADVLVARGRSRARGWRPVPSRARRRSRISGSFIAARGGRRQRVVRRSSPAGSRRPRPRRTPPIAMSIAAGSTSTPDEPTAWRIRPGFGSPPNAAVFTSGESATAFATTRASASSTAPATSTSSTCVTPSASAASWRSSDSPTSPIAAASASHAGRVRRHDRPRPAGAAREQQHGVVRAGARVDGERVEPRPSAARRPAGAGSARGDACVGRDERRASSRGSGRSSRRPSRTRRPGTRPPRRSPACRPCRWS